MNLSTALIPYTPPFSPEKYCGRVSFANLAVPSISPRMGRSAILYRADMSSAIETMQRLAKQVLKHAEPICSSEAVTPSVRMNDVIWINSCIKKRGIDVNAVDFLGRNALNSALNRMILKVEGCRALIQLGINPEHTHDKNTPLASLIGFYDIMHCASDNTRSLYLIRCLLESGADLHVKFYFPIEEPVSVLSIIEKYPEIKAIVEDVNRKKVKSSHSFKRPPSENPLLNKFSRDLCEYIHACLDPRSTKAFLSTSKAAIAAFANPDPEAIAALRFSSKPEWITLEELRACKPEFFTEKELRKKFSLNLSYSRISDDELGEIIARFPNIRGVDLSRCKQITDIGFAYLQSLTQLSSLTLTNCYKITNIGFAYLQGLPQLASLGLSECSQITDADLAHLQPLTQLTCLNLDSCKITDAGLPHLQLLPQLTSLKLTLCKITDVGLVHLQPLKQLSFLDLSCTKVTDVGLTHLQGLPLIHLDLKHCQNITDVGLAHLQALKQLSSLCLRGGNITDASLTHLQRLPFTRLNFSWCSRITDAGIAHLQELTQLSYLILEGCRKITDKSLAYLEKTQLTHLDLEGCDQITDAGCLSLAQRIPSKVTIRKFGYICHYIDDE